jgi:hypothetical protein
MFSEAVMAEPWDGVGKAAMAQESLETELWLKNMNF